MVALHELRTHLEAQEIRSDSLQIGAALLALARARGWNQNPLGFAEWLEDLALDVAKNWHHGEVHDQSIVDTVPIHELRKIAEALKREREKDKGS